MFGKKKRSVIEARKPLPKPARVRIPVALLIRMFVIGSVAVGASIWALWRHYTVTPMPMLVPTPSASEIEVESLPRP